MVSPNIAWTVKPFHELTALELYHLLALRINVFVVEQNCPYPETDGKDIYCNHVLGYDNGTLAACARIVPAGISYDEISIGRVAVEFPYRRAGLGKLLMEKVLMEIYSGFQNAPIRISAQSYLIDFYSNYGFKAIGNEYLEDDIPHMQMLRGVH